MNTISNISIPTKSPEMLRGVTTQQMDTQQADTQSFKNFLLDSIQHVNTMQQQADQSVESLFTGGDVNPAEVLTAVQKADLTFKMMMQVRNKLVQVYQEVQDIRI